MSEVRDVHEPPANSIHPVIDGEVTSYFEWMGAGHYRPDRRSGAMQGPRLLVSDLFYGAGNDNLYLRLDFENSGEFTKVELRIAGREPISLLGRTDVESAHRKILEIRVPLPLLGLSKDQTLGFQLALANQDLPLDVIPPSGWIEFNPSEQLT
jgi:hypothetical protein